MSESILTITLNPAIDVFINRKSKHSLQYYAGGKGINVSRCLKALKISSTNSGIIAGRVGSKIKSLLNQEGLSEKFLNSCNESRINYSYIEPPSDIERFIEKGPVVDFTLEKKFIDLYKRQLGGVAVVVLSGSILSGMSLNIYHTLLLEAEKRRVPVCLDSSGLAFKLGVQGAPLMIKPNIKEFEELIGRRVKNRKHLLVEIQKLHKKGIQYILVSLDSKGLIASNSKEVYWAPGFRGTVISDVGSGDAVVAGFVFAYMKNSSFEEMVKIAASAGNLNCENLVPGFIDGQKLGKMIKSVKVKRI